MAVDIASLIHKGGVFMDISGDTPEMVYRQICDSMQLPSDITANTI